MAALERITELRLELPADELSVIDGYCAATEQHRTSVVRRILREWSAAKLHEATLIVRVAGCNPAQSEPGRV